MARLYFNGMFMTNDKSSSFRTTLTAGGRVVIPVEYRKELGMEVGQNLVIRLVDGEIRIMTSDQAIRTAQNIARKYIPKKVSLVDELLAERAAAAQRENED